MNQLENFFVATGFLSPSSLQSLQKYGFRTLRDFQSITPKQLTQETKIPIRETAKIITFVKQLQLSQATTSDHQPTPTTPNSAYQLLLQQLDPSDVTTTTKSSISTRIRELDDILDGGVSQNEVTEICGPPGIGKTQLCMQLALTVQVSPDHGGLASDAIYIDTEGSFMVERVREMAEALNQQFPNIPTDSFLKGISYYRVHDYEELRHVFNVLPSFLDQNPKIKLVVVDSIAFHFRHDFEDMGERARALSSLSLNLHQMSAKYSLAVVLVNQVTTKLQKSTQDPGQENTSVLVPALGDIWAHAVTNRLMLSRKDQLRQISLIKCPYRKQASTNFEITKQGITGVNLRKRPHSEVCINR